MSKQQIGDDQTSNNILKALVELNINLNLTKKGLKQNLQALKQIQYPNEDQYRYLSLLKQTKQSNFSRISEYHEEIQKLVIRHEACINETNYSIDSKIKEYFFSNLHPKTTIRLVELGVTSLENAITCITNVENQLFSQIHQKSRNRPNDNTQFKSQKFCMVHKSGSHNSEECNSIQKLKQERKDYTEKSNKRINTIIQNQDKLFELKGKINNIPVTFIIDTGASQCFISEKISKKLKLKLNKSYIETVKSAFNESQKTNGTFETEVKFQSIPHKTFKIKLHEISHLQDEVILGLNFLKANKAKLNFEEGSIIIDGNETEVLRSTKRRLKLSKIKSECYSKEQISERLKNMEHESLDIGTIKDAIIDIPLTDESKIATQHEYMVPLAKRDIVKEHIKELENKKIIRRSKSNFCSPAFIIPKPDGDIRMVVDYKNLNKITKNMYYPFPRIEEQFLHIDGSKWFSKIDIRMGYHQMEVFKNDIHKTAFGILGEKYEFCKMPFGLKNAPFYFQRAMKNVLKTLEFVNIFIDDILIFSKNHNDHVKHINIVLDKLVENNVIINYKKSEFFKQELTYLGHVINREGIKPQLDQIEKLNNVKTPKTKKHVMKLIGLIQWFRPYIKNLSQKIIQITSKLQKDIKFCWSSSDTETINDIVYELKNQPILFYPNLNQTFVIHTDASETACGAILSQEKGVVRIYSHKFNSVELNYTIVEKEFLAVILALRHFRNIILGTKIIIKTDNKNIVNYHGAKYNRIKRWKDELIEFNPELEHISEKENVGADALSRLLKIDTMKPLNDKEFLTKYHLEQGFSRGGPGPPKGGFKKFWGAG